ncbi:MAG TPA: FlgD immunoglobulin-like domain containing protein [candidate division Zixibacteria bacterium]|nr:FlgD immunoglobulin-like domain containing protein [candidate division Zixibacteria bacterium]
MNKIKIPSSILLLFLLFNFSSGTENQFSKFSEYYQKLQDSREALGLSDISSRLERDFYHRNFPAGIQSNSFYSSSFTDPWSPHSAYTDLKVNSDTFPATFFQGSPDIIMFADKSFLAVWEDERNGDLDILAQKFDSSGTPILSTLEVNDETIPADQFLASADVSPTGKVVVTWVDGKNLEIKAQRLDNNLNKIGANFKVNSGPNNSAYAPSVTVASNGNFIITWEDVRFGYSIYAQRYDSSGSAIGGNFQVSTDAGSFPHLYPAISSDGKGNFVIVWEDYRNFDGDIYFQKYDSAGVAQDSNTQANSDAGTEDQYQPDVAKRFDGKMIFTWVDMVNVNQDIYFQRADSGGVLQGLPTKVNSDAGIDPQWEPSVDTDSLGNFMIAWSDYRSLPAIYLQRYDTLGNTLGINIHVSDIGQNRERHSPSLYLPNSGDLVIGWMDYRTKNYDIFLQRMTTSGTKKGANFKANSDLTGAQQKTPSLAVNSKRESFVVWEDFRSGNADIFFRQIDQQGNFVTAEMKVSDDTSILPQLSPDIATDDKNSFFIVWQDFRNGVNIYGQFYNFLIPLGNIKVNEDTSINIHQHPAVSASQTGKFVAVWSDNRDGNFNIYGQRYTSLGANVGSNFKVNDDVAPNDHFSPQVASDSLGNFVVVWEDYRDSQVHIYMQAYDSSGSPLGTNLRVQSDSSNTTQIRPDVARTVSGEFAVSWLETRAAGDFILAQRYDASRQAVDPNLVISDTVAVNPFAPRIALDKNQTLLVTWEDSRLGHSDIRGQFFYSSNDSMGPDFKVNQDLGTALQFTPVCGFSSDYAYFVWSDNRNPGLGFDIYANIYVYKGTEVKPPKSISSAIPKAFALEQNYPNPFNAATVIKYHLKAANSSSNQISTSLKVYNIKGELVKTLVQQNQVPGIYQVSWDGKNERGQTVSTGVYFYLLEAGEHKEAKKMLLLK